LLGLETPDLAAARVAWRPGRRRGAASAPPAITDLWDDPNTGSET
jgi:hypothetical protein